MQPNFGNLISGISAQIFPRIARRRLGSDSLPRSPEFHYPAQWVATLVAKGVLREAEIPASIRTTWLPPFGDRRQEIVFIGVGLDAARLEAELDACLQPDAATCLVKP